MGNGRNLVKLRENIFYYQRTNGSRMYYVRYKGVKLNGYTTDKEAIEALEALKAGKQPEIPKVKKIKADRGWSSIGVPGVYKHMDQFGHTTYAAFYNRKRLGTYETIEEAEAVYRAEKEKVNGAAAKIQEEKERKEREREEKWKKTLPKFAKGMTQEERDDATCLVCKWHGLTGAGYGKPMCRYSLEDGNHTRRKLMRDRTGSDVGHLTHGELCTEFERGTKPPSKFTRQ